VLRERRRARLARRIVNAAAALGASVALLVVLATGYGPLPGLGPALDPGHGAWAAASTASLPVSQTLHLRGLTRPVRVSFTAQGIASITAASQGDLFLALGYVHARFRLAQMDLERRLGEGRLAQLAGTSAVASDKFELQLGLLRTARQEWADMPRSSPAARALLAYSAGVNDYLAGAAASGQWPSLFSLAGVYPAHWTPVDSLVIQGDLTEELDFTTVPLDYALLGKSLGVRRTMSWFPVQPPGPQHPFDTGPYRNRGIAPIVTSGWLGGRAGASRSALATGATGPARGGLSGSAVIPGSSSGAAAILAEVRSLPLLNQVHEYPDSNAWAASGARVAGHGAMLGGDPHLPLTLPSIWYQVALSAPGLAVSGVSTPGLPGVLLGHNTAIAWSLTDTQNQSAMFYDEHTSASRPGEYLWHGQWRRMSQVHYTIPVRGGAARRLTVDITVHGPVMTQARQTVSVDWMGAVPSPDLEVLLDISKATSFAGFRAALANWRAPTENFVYADRRGHIGAIAAGYFPLVRHGDPWLPMPGTGADDVAGVIPYASAPQAYDPPGHVIATANQRPAGASYPYYIGTSANAFDPGYRAAQEYSYLGSHRAMTSSDFAGLQGDLTDQLARRVVPRLLAALRHAPLTAAAQQARQVLSGWNYWMGATSAAGALWWTFWGDYLSAVFQPWWSARRVPVHLDRFGLGVGPGQFSLDEVLASWTSHDPRNGAFTPPGAGRRTAVTVLRAAFETAVAQLSSRLGASPANWAWDKVHFRDFPSLIPGVDLGYGPKPAGGDSWTVDAAYGAPVSRVGPSWRMIVGWTRSGRPVAEGIYPGGQAENPASPWYENLIADWWAGRYLPMPVAGADTGPVRWELAP
jgi:penicillin amidase